MPVAPPVPWNPNLRFAVSLLEALAEGGVREVCLAPGSRSAPLAVAATRVPALRRFVHVDERTAGFFALGLARAARRPVALVCTSGTAAANLFPAVMEAGLARVPLVVLTADRPPELRDWGAPQTADQVRLFGSHVRWDADAPPPAASAEAAALGRALGARAAWVASRPPAGPVHLNLPFREPLDPVHAEEGDAAAAAAPRPAPCRAAAEGAPSARQLDALHARVAAARRPVLVCGPQHGAPDLADAVGAFARRSGWPVLAETTSGVRCGPHVEGAAVLGTFGLLLRAPAFAARMAPDLVLRLGAPPTTKALGAWRAAHPHAAEVVIDEAAGFRDPGQSADLTVEADPARTLEALTRRLRAPLPDPGWRAAWRAADKRADEARRAVLEADGLLAPRAAALLFEALPPGAGLWLASSMAVRDADLAIPVSEKPLQVHANRGANGIDGTVASALGARAAGLAPLALLTGDLALLHDLGSLLEARRQRLDATVVVLNDDGGGIFAHLPIASHGAAVAYDELFRVRHGVPLGPAVEGLGARHHLAASPDALRAALAEALPAPGLDVVEVPLDAERNRDHHRRLEEAVARALGDGASPPSAEEGR